MLGRHVQLRQLLLQHEEALVVRLLDKELISFIVDDHLKFTEVKVALAGSKTILKVAWDCDKDLTLICEAFLS